MSKKMKILEVSACGNKQAAEKLRFAGNMDTRIIRLIDSMLAKNNWDLISIRDVPWHTLEKLQHLLGVRGYRMYIHKSWKDIKQKWRYTCLSALFVKSDISFVQMYTSDRFETVLRYVAGKISLAGYEIVYKTSHIPCVDDTRSRLSHQIARKTGMLEDEVQFQKDNDAVLAISSGDFNGGPSGEWYGQELYDQFVFRDTVHGHTYEDKMIDHVFISEGIRNSNISVKTEILEEAYMVLTDHRMISITLEA